MMGALNLEVHTNADEGMAVGDEPLARNSHYVPEAYLRRFSPEPGGQFVHVYSLLVPHERIKPWDFVSAGRIAMRRDFYTSVATGKESDRIETWLANEIEYPALSVLDKLTVGSRLDGRDRTKLARYIASLDARSPLSYSRHTQMLADALPSVLDARMKGMLESLERGEPIPDLPECGATDYPVVSVKLNRGDPGADNAHLDVNVVVGRETWLHSIEHLVNEVSVLLEDHDWRVIRPHAGWTWYTSDSPVVKLVLDKGRYHFNGKWGDVGTEIMLPLSPSHLLYAQVGRPTRHEQFSLNQTYFVKRFIAENAYRWIVSQRAVRHATWFRPRRVNLDEFNAEQRERGEFHEQQSKAIFDLGRRASPPGPDAPKALP